MWTVQLHNFSPPCFCVTFSSFTVLENLMRHLDSTFPSFCTTKTLDFYKLFFCLSPSLWSFCQGNGENLFYLFFLSRPAGGQAGAGGLLLRLLPSPGGATQGQVDGGQAAAAAGLLRPPICGKMFLPLHQRWYAKWKLSWNMYYTFIHAFALLVPICMLSRCLLTSFLHRSSVGSLLRVRCWLGRPMYWSAHGPWSSS